MMLIYKINYLLLCLKDIYKDINLVNFESKLRLHLGLLITEEGVTIFCSNEKFKVVVLGFLGLCQILLKNFHLHIYIK